MKPDSENILSYQQFMPEKVSISTARSKLPKLVQTLGEEPNKIYEVDRHDTPLALLLSYEIYNPIVQALKTGNLTPILANLIQNKWFDVRNTPLHISRPQLKELESMDLAQLLVLFQELPCDSIDRINKKDELNMDLVKRLIKRRKISNAISQAEKDGLYEVSENLSDSN